MKPKGDIYYGRKKNNVINMYMFYTYYNEHFSTTYFNNISVSIANCKKNSKEYINEIRKHILWYLKIRKTLLGIIKIMHVV